MRKASELFGGKRGGGRGCGGGWCPEGVLEITLAAGAKLV